MHVELVRYFVVPDILISSANHGHRLVVLLVHHLSETSIFTFNAILSSAALVLAVIGQICMSIDSFILALVLLGHCILVAIAFTWFWCISCSLLAGKISKAIEFCRRTFPLLFSLLFAHSLSVSLSLSNANIFIFCLKSAHTHTHIYSDRITRLKTENYFIDTKWKRMCKITSTLISNDVDKLHFAKWWPTLDALADGVCVFLSLHFRCEKSGVFFRALAADHQSSNGQWKRKRNRFAV